MHFVMMGIVKPYTLLTVFISRNGANCSIFFLQTFPKAHYESHQIQVSLHEISMKRTTFVTCQVY